jgi:hypothetical protein
MMGWFGGVRPAMRMRHGRRSTPRAPGASMRTLMQMFGLRQSLMLRLAALLSVLIAMQGAAIADDAKQDTVEVHGKSLQLSCAEWKRGPDGSWTSIGALLVGTETMTVTLRGPKETKVLEAKCGDTQEPIVAPAQSAEPTRHARHAHHHAEPAD